MLWNGYLLHTLTWNCKNNNYMANSYGKHMAIILFLLQNGSPKQVKQQIIRPLSSQGSHLPFSISWTKLPKHVYLICI